MKHRILLTAALTFASVAATAQVGAPYIHDPSTIMECDGKYYTFGTGENGIMSEDGWVWHDGAIRPHRGAAPDAIKIGDRYLVGFSSTGGGLGGGHAGNVLTMWTKTLDPNSPDFGYTEPVVVAESRVDEDCDAIDIGLFMDPTTGRLWCTYGTYFGFIRQVELNPATGARLEGAEDINVAIDCEASDMIYRNGWYYLLGTHGTCCDGTNSTYNIVCGRSRSVNGPFIDNVGRDMLRGGGKMVAYAENRRVGAGHFGRIILGEGIEKTSFHWEADYDLSGRSTLAIRPLLWVNDWPVAGELFEEGSYAIISERRGYALELEVDFVRETSGMRGWWMAKDEAVVALENQKLDEVSASWPDSEVNVRISDYMNRPHQRWDITPVPEAGGYLGGPWFKITINGTQRALAATAGKDVVVVPHFTGAPEQLWRIDQLTDGTYRIMPKEVPGCSEELCLVSVADCTPTLGTFDFNSDNSKWHFKTLNCKPDAGNTFKNTGNPLFRNRYTADPATLVSNGRLYVYCGHDECFEDRPGYEGKYGFNITDWVCYSTEDMQTWTDHGVVLKPTDFSWCEGEAWASQVIEKNGKYYFYSSCQSTSPCYGKAIGVAVSDSPLGPFVDALGKPLVNDEMTDNGQRGWWNDFDPTVLIDDDGTAWMVWGNGTCFMAKLKDNMIEIDGDIRVLDVPSYVEGPWLHKRGDMYYLTYPSINMGGETMGFGGETISYCTAPGIEGPWTFRGLLTGTAKDSFTIHPAICEFKGHWYLFYHNSTLSLDGYGPATGRRSVCVDELFYNPDGTMKYVEQTEKGIAR